MKYNVCISLFVACLMVLSCGTDDAEPEAPLPPASGGSTSIPGCNVELVKVLEIVSDGQVEGTLLGDYIFTIKSITTVKEDISVEAIYVKDGVAALTLTVSAGVEVGINETIEIKIATDDINTAEDYDCMEYFIKVKAEGTSGVCSVTGTDC